MVESVAVYPRDDVTIEMGQDELGRVWMDVLQPNPLTLYGDTVLTFYSDKGDFFEKLAQAIDIYFRENSPNES